jgi:hypothetical protein
MVKADFQRRVDVLRKALRPARPADVQVCILHMLIGFSSSRGSAEDQLTLARVYSEDLAPFPFWAIDRACRAFRTGAVTGVNRAFAPSTADLCAYVREIVFRHERELGRLVSVLGARMLEDLPAKNVEAVDKVLADMKADMAKKRQNFEDEPRPPQQTDAEMQAVWADIARRRKAHEKPQEEPAE